jgi:KDO2-lipid IV(A) lauroyltransferase
MHIPLRLRHALEYAAVVGVRELFRHLPPDRSVAVGARIGRLYARLRGPRTADAAINIALAFPESSDREREDLLLATFANLGRCIADVFLLQGRHRERLLAGLRVEGVEHYEEARQRSESGGMIVLTAHFGSWELAGAAMAQRGYPVSVVHHGVSNPYLDAMVGGWRRAATVGEIRLGRASLGVFRALSKGRAVALLLDQNAHRDEGVFAPFFGQSALTRSAPASIAMNRGVPVLPVFVFREGASARHVVRFEAALDLEPAPGGDGDDGDAERALLRNVARMNGAIESAVRAAPDHWLWPHRRFKTRPEGESPVYPRRPSRRSAAGR